MAKPKKINQGYSSKELKGMGDQPALSAKMGGVSNATKPNSLPSSKKGK